MFSLIYVLITQASGVENLKMYKELKAPQATGFVLDALVLVVPVSCKVRYPSPRFSNRFAERSSFRYRVPGYV